MSAMPPALRRQRGQRGNFAGAKSDAHTGAEADAVDPAPRGVRMFKMSRLISVHTQDGVGGSGGGATRAGSRAAELPSRSADSGGSPTSAAGSTPAPTSSSSASTPPSSGDVEIQLSSFQDGGFALALSNGYIIWRVSKGRRPFTRVRCSRGAPPVRLRTAAAVAMRCTGRLPAALH
jgi:hypothetical protein